MRTITVKALLVFMNYSDADLSTFAARVIKALTGNDSFPDCAPLLPGLKAALDNYTTLLSLAQGGSRVQIEEKNVAKNALRNILRDICRLVNFAGNGNRLILLSSGYDVTSETKKQAAPADVHELKAA